MDILDFPQVAAGIIGALLTGLLGYFGIVRKARSDEIAIALEAWKSLLEPLQEELRSAKEEIASLRRELAERDAYHTREIEKLLVRLRKVQNTQNK